MWLLLIQDRVEPITFLNHYKLIYIRELKIIPNQSGFYDTTIFQIKVGIYIYISQYIYIDMMVKFILV